jgi:hypothetical protein
MAAWGRYANLSIVKRVFCLADAAHGDRAVSCPYPATGRQKIPLD